MALVTPELPDSRRRILAATRTALFAHGYSALTMDDLATELGMSKKTLYQHFSAKEELVGAALDEFAREVRAEADRVLADRGLGFAEKLQTFTTGMLQRLGRIQPHVLRDLQRFAPTLHTRLVALRRENLPYIFGRLLEQGRLAGKVRADLDADFAAHFLMHAMQGLMLPENLEHLQLAPHEAFGRAMNVFFGGLLTPVGRKEYEKILAR
jgi:AcrR family transcriptional regulator